MGLAAYGNPTKESNNFFASRNIADDSLFDHKLINGDMCAVLKGFPITDTVTKENYQIFADHAFQVQKQTQEAVSKIISAAIKETGLK